MLNVVVAVLVTTSNPQCESGKSEIFKSTGRTLEVESRHAAQRMLLLRQSATDVHGHSTAAPPRGPGYMAFEEGGMRPADYLMCSAPE